ncbi:MAG: hypothetical protein E7017_03600 [Alphaproteobacteria bacterium]|nr:hypothetical protein [Alphaproteobacteria bacterium]
MDNQTPTGRPQLKKIKRPINRTAPVSSPTPPSAMANPFGSKPSVSKQSQADFSDIDNYLDDKSSSVPSREVNTSSFSENNGYPQYLDEQDYQREVYGREDTESNPAWLSVKMLSLISVLCLFMGIVAGKFLFAESRVVRNGLQGVVVNNEVPRGRARCGVAERGQGCVLYIMNPQRQDMSAKDFYDLAAQMTGRQRFMIETGNMRYANTKIRPGDIVQLNIPPL